jgi:hypothetical protein
MEKELLAVDLEELVEPSDGDNERAVLDASVSAEALEQVAFPSPNAG